MTANGSAGTYSVTAILGALPPATFTLTNAAVVTLGQIAVPNVSVGQNLQVALTITLPVVAGAGGVPVTIASSDPTRLLIGSVGRSSVQISVPEGQTQISTLVQGLVGTGAVAVTATATGFTDGSGTVTLTPSGFVLAGPNDVGASFQTFQGLTTTITVFAAQLDATGRYVAKQSLRSSLTSAVSVSVANAPALGTLTPVSVTLNPGDVSAQTAFKALNSGTTTITAQTPAGFTVPTDGSNTVAATILASGLNLPGGITVGQNLQTTASIALNGVAPPAGLAVTVTSSDPTRLRFSTSATTAGSASIVLNLPANAHATPEFYVQGFGSSGTVGYSAQASGFGTANGTITLAPSGIVFSNLLGGVPNPVLAAAGGSPVTVNVFSAILDGSGNWVSTQSLAGGLSATVNVTNAGSAAVGTVNPTQLTIAGGSSIASTQFQPASQGTTTLAVSVPATPAGFSTPSLQYATLPVSVTTSKVILTLDQAAIGNNLQAQGSVVLSQAAPANGVTVTLSTSSGKLLFATSPADAGQPTLQINIAAGSTFATYYVQAISDTGTATYSGSATGYADGNAEIFLTPSGVVVSSTFGLPFLSVGAGSTVDAKVSTAQLDPNTLAFSAIQPLRGGLSLTVVVGTGNGGIATVDSPVVIAAGTDTMTTTVHGVGAGQTPLTVTQPPGFVAATNPVFAFQPMPSIQVTVN